MSNNTLRECPFCGGEAEVQWESTQGMVSCTNEDCYATSTWYDSNNAAEVRDYVVSRWNKRAAPPAMPEEVRQTMADTLEVWLVTLEEHAKVYLVNDEEMSDAKRRIDAALQWLEVQKGNHDRGS